MNEVVLYQVSHLLDNKPVVLVANKAKRKIKGFKVLGLLLLLVSFAGISLNFGPLLAKESRFRVGQAQKEAERIVENKPKQESAIKFADLLGQAKFEDIPVPEDTQFSVVIPKINVNENVIANVDPEKPNEFKKILKNGVAHALGSAYPGQGGTIYLFAHSALYQWDIKNYNAVFYQLKDLEIGDEVNVFYNDRRYFYKVFESKIVKPSEVGFLLGNQGERLVLQTCWPLGSTKERLVVITMPVGVSLSYNLTN